MGRKRSCREVSIYNFLLFSQGIKQEIEKHTAKWDEEFSVQNQKPVKLSKKEKKTLKEEKKKLKNKKLDVDKVRRFWLILWEKVYLVHFYFRTTMRQRWISPCPQVERWRR